MKKKIKDYLHLYIGSDVMTPDGIVKMEGVANGVITYSHLDGGVGEYTGEDWLLDEIKPILRPLPNMTEDEKKHIEDMHESVFHGGFKGHGKGFAMLALESESTRYLISKGFDLFGLIQAGLAIDKTSMPV